MAISVKVSALTEDVAAAPANAVDADGTIALEQPRKVLLSLSPDDVQELRRDGDDLLVRTTDGQVIRIENFYGGAETTTSQLYLTGDDQELIWADLSSAGGDGVIAADYFPQGEFGVFEPVSVAGGESEGASITPLGWAAIGGGALAAGAIAAGGGGGGGSDDDDGGTAPPDDGENGEGDTTAPDAPTLDPSNGETISGEAEPGSTVIITDGDGNTIGEATTDDDGNWTLTPDEPLPDGTDIEVVAQDPAGNTSEPTTGTIDAAAPDAPTLDPSNGETISGEAEPGSTVIITDGDGNPIGETTTDDDGNWTLTPDEPLPDGTDIEVVAQDPTGNTSEPTTGTIDAVAPNAPTLDPSNGETISGEAEPGSTVIITDGDGNPIGETTTDDDGNWTLTPDEPLPDGTDIEVVAQDPAGNTSEPTTGTIDAAAPDAPTLDPSNGETISGEAEPGSTVIITDGDGNPIGETTTDEDGNWTLTPDEPLPDGTDIEVVAQDPTGNTSEPTTGTIDAAAPDAPTITTVMDDVDPQTGELATGDSTNDTTPRLTGQAEAGSTVTIFANGEQTGTTTADDQGNWAFTPDDLDDGDYTFSATATDSVGNVSDGSDGYALTIDTSAPNSPTVDPSDGSVLIGTAEAGSVVTLTDDEGNAVGQTTTDENGNWSFQPDDPLADGTEIEATATDAAGNVSAPATVITDANPSDTTPPATPSITLASDDTMPQTGDLDSGDSTNDATPTLSGQAESRSIVTVYSGETQLGTTIANADGEWAFTPESLDDGDYTFNVTATDSAGNMSDSSDSFTLTVDTQPPVAPIVDPTNGEILTGSAEAGSTVTLTDDDGDTIATVTSDVNGNWSYAPDAPLEDGSTFTAVATDAAGNASDPGSATVDADLVDTQPPSEPVIITSIDTTEPVTGNVDDGDTTNDPSPTLIGTAEATNMVQVWADDGSGSGSGSGMQMLGTTQADNFGNWSFRIFSRLAEGNTSFMAKSIDPTGQESDSSQPFAVVIDITPPATPTIDSATDDVDPGGMLDDGDNTNDATPTLIGTAEANAVVAILAGGTQIGTVAADDNGDWTFTPDALPDGNVDFTATATDAAGNVSPASPSFTVSVDTAAPATPTIEPTDGNTITGTAEPGSTITLTDGEGNVIAEDVATDPDDGSWSVTPETPLDDGGTVNAVATDQAGNASDPATEIVDATAPNANDNSIQINDGGDGFLNVEEAGNVTLAGQVEDGASIASLTITSANGGDPVVIDGDEITLGDDGSFTYNADLSGLADGELTATLALSDAAGNDGTVTDTTTLDQTAPIVTLDALDEPINDITPAITGTVDDAGATVSVSVNGGEPITATVDEDGNWTVPADSVTLNEGDNTIEVTATDAAGNPATPATDTVSVDITAPTVAVDDLITNDTTPALSGTVDDAEATVTVTVDGDDYTATNNGDGTWALADDIVAELDPGAASISVTATDLAGNEATATGTVTVDITAPGDGDDGLNSVAFADDVYNAAEADTATLAGQVEDGASIASLTIISANGGDPVVIDGDEITLGDDGSFTYNADLSGLADGELTATLTLSDAAGNDGTVTDTATLDQTAPIVAIDALDEPINDTTPAITGTVDDPDATVSVSVNGGEPITATVDEDGNWNVSADSVTLNEGDNTIEVTATDAAGNPATPATDTVSVDITAPGDGDDGLNSVAFADDVYNAAEADTAALAGQIEGGASIASLTITSANGGDPVVIDGDEITLGDNGSFTYNADLSGLADGELTATLALSDAAGNDGTVTDTATLDQTAPTVAIDALDEPINDTTPAITGTVDDPGATVSVSVNGGEPITATVDNNGNWNVPADSVTLNEGDNTIEVTATDAAGNPSTPATDTVSVDITAPGEGEGDNSVTIVSGDDELLSLDEAGNVTLTGQVEDGASIASLVITSVNGGDPLEIDPATIDIAADGSFSLDGIDVTGLNDGELTATLTVEDAAGNAAEFTDTATLDTVAPNVPTIDPTNGDTITGTAEVGSTVTVTDADGEVVGEPVLVGDDGTWTVTPDAPLADGDTVTATATDPAGNASDPATEIVDTVADAGPTASLVINDDDGLISADEATAVSFTVEDLDTDASGEVTFTDVNGNSALADVEADGTFNIDLSGLADGEITSSLSITDTAGNTATVPGDTLTLDTVAPNVPTIDPTNGDTITGTAEVGSTVTVTDADGEVVGEPVLVGDDGTWTVAPDAPLTDGDTVTATATDPAGNASDPATETVDTAPPAEGDNSVTIVSGDDELLSTDEAGNVTLTGQVEDGASIASLIVADSEGNSAIVTLDQITLNADGSFVTDAIDLSALADGELTATLTVEDAAGNAAEFTDTATLDTVAPNAPTIDPTNGDDITGTAEVGSTVTVTDADGNVVGEPILVGDDGIWTVTPDTPLADGDTVTATATDPAGNSSDPATEIVDATAPNAGDNSVTIVSGDDELLSAAEATGVTLAGQVEDGASIASLVIADSEGNSAIVTLDQITLDPDGSFVTEAIDLSALADGELTATLTVEDAAGNAAEFTDTATLDTVAPNVPTIDPTNGDTITGTAEVGSTVTVTDADGEVVGEPVLVGDDGTWTVTPDAPLADGDTVTATATDPAGNASDPATEIVDTVADAGPTASLVINDDDGLISADEATAVSFTVEDLDTDASGEVTFTDVNGNSALADVEADGTFNIDLSGLADGEITSSLSITDTAGNTATVPGDTLTLDTVAPNVPTIDPTNGDTITGTAEVGSTVTVTDDQGATIGEPVLVGDDGTWTVTPDAPLADGDAVTATATDPAGNASDPATETVDTLPPADGLNSVTIVSGDDELLSTDEAGNVTLTGQVEDGASIASLIVADSDGNSAIVTLDQITLNADGSFVTDAIDLSALADGELTATLTVEDAAGNTAPFTDTATLDTVAPDAPTFDPTDGDAITGTAEVGSTVTVTDADGNVVGEPVLVGDDGTWSVTPDAPLADGNEVTATATDPAGNVSGPATETVDTAPPAEGDNSVTIVSGDDELLSTDEAGNVTLTGQVEDGASIASLIVADSEGNSAIVTLDQITLNPDGSFVTDAIDLSALADGELTATLTVEDAAGNTAPFTDTATLDTVAPDAPTIDPTDGDAITGTAEVGSTVTVTDDQGATIGEPILVGDDGIWTVTPDTPLADGDAVTATATDPAGNVSGPATETVDVDALLPPTITLPETDDGFLNADELADGVQILADLPADAAVGDVINVTLAGSTGGIGGTYTLTQRDLNVGQALFEIEGDLADGDYTATSTLTRGDGSGSAPSDGYDFTVDTTPPGLPILALNPVSAVLSIDAEPDSVVRLAVGLAGQEVSLVVPTDENGDASVNLLADIGLDLDLSDIAQLGISVAAEDQAGNTSGFATIGLNPPDAAPPLPATDVAISDDGTTLSGVAEANATVLVDLDMDGTGDLTTTADDDGNFSFTVDPPLVDGELIDVIVVDAIGNASDPVAALAPRDEPAGGFAPRVFVQSVEGGYINADAADGGIDTRVRLPSDAAEGDTLTLQLTGGDGTTVAQDYLLTADDLAGRFLELTLDAVGGAFPQGAATIASIIDRGDSQTGSNSVAFDLDTIAPSTPVVDFLGTALSISGEPGSTVEVGISLAGVTTSVTFDVTDEEPVLLDLLGDISLDINPADLLNASVSVVGRDAAGNESSVAELNLGAGLLDGSDLVTIGGLGITDVSLGSLIPLSGPRLVIGGNTTPNSTLALTVGLLGGTATLDVMADENGDFGVNLLSADTISDLGLGVTGLVTELLSNPDLLSGISISATATNPEGNTSTEYGLSLSGSGVDLAIGAITIEGEDGGDRLTGTDQVEEIAAGDGDDIILNVGAGDTVEAGAGDDLIVTSGTDFDSIDGGDGFDTLLLDGGIDLDMVNGDVGAIGNVERLDLGQGDDASTVTLSAEDVDAMTDDDNVLQITGDQQDTLNIQGATSDGTVTLGGTAYDQYTFGDTAIQVEQDTVQVET